MKVAVLGYGVVGKGVYDMLRTCTDLEAGPVLVRPGKADESFKVDDIEKIIADDSVCAVAEVMGGVDVPYAYACKAIKAGKHFVTSNKALVAAKGVELKALAIENKVGFLFSAACGGAVPFLHNLELARQADEIESLGGILNGTTNYMLDRMQSEGLDYDAALKEAQELGYAEADPTADVTGLDALRKIMLGCAVAYDKLPTEGLYNEGIDSLKASDVAHFQARGLTCRLLAKGGMAADKLYAYVQPVLVGADAPECAVKKNFNMAKYMGKCSGQIVLMGQGAGRYPTASAVLRDLQCLVYGQRKMFGDGCEYAQADNEGCICSYYVRVDEAFAHEFELADPEALDGAVYGIVENVSVRAMHEKARALRKAGAQICFAEI